MTSYSALIGIICLFAFIAVAFGVYAFKAPSHAPLLDADTSADWWVPQAGEGEATFFDRFLRPGIHNLLPQTPLSLMEGARRNQRIVDLLVKSGNPWRIRPEEFVGLLIFAVLLGTATCLAAALAGILPTEVPLLGWALLGGVGAFTLPWFSLQDKVKVRLRQARRALPEALDLLVISMYAGRNFSTAVTEVAERLPEGIIQEEFTRLSRNIRAGRTVPEALAEFANRTPGPEVESFAKAIMQAEALGADVTQTLAAQAEAARFNYEMMIDAKIGRLNTTLIAPMALFIVPALCIVLIAPAMSGIGEMF